MRAIWKAGLGALALVTLPAVAGATVVNIDGPSTTGTTLTLAAGTYTAAFIQDAYTAWNPWSYTTCSGPGGSTGCQGWTNRLDIYIGTDGTYTTYDVGNSAANGALFYADAATALSVFQAAQANGTLDVLGRGADGSVLGRSTTGLISFTLADATTVRFVADDSTYGDNQGGISLELTQIGAPVPEPATWAMMVAGFGLAGGALRRRRIAVAFARG